MLTPASGRDSEPTASFAVACAPEHRATLPLPLHMASLQTLCACASGAAQTFILARVCMRMNTSHARNLCKSAAARGCITASGHSLGAARRQERAAAKTNGFLCNTMQAQQPGSQTCTVSSAAAAAHPCPSPRFTLPPPPTCYAFLPSHRGLTSSAAACPCWSCPTAQQAAPAATR